MGTYNIPRNLKGESRVLIIFSIKSLFSTIIGAIIGLLFFFIFSMMGIKIVGIILLVLFAIIGYIVGAVKIPTLKTVPITKKIGGESIYEIVARYMKFRMNKKIYTYTKEEDE